jgi:translation initiation factor IF-2
MRVLELAKDLKVEPEILLHLLREMGIPVAGTSASVNEADVSRVLARVERERRAGHKGASEAVQAALDDASTGPRRRRRRRADPEPEPDEAVDEDASAVEEATAVVRASDVGAADRDEASDDDDAPAAAVEVRDDPVGLDEEARARPDRTRQDAKIPAVSDPSADDVEDEVDSDQGEILIAEDDDVPVAAGVVSEGGLDEEEAPPRSDAPEGEDEDLVEEMDSVDIAVGVDGEVAGEKPQPARRGAPEGPARRLVKKPQPAASAGPGGQVRIQAEGYTTDGRRKRDKKKGKRRQRVDQDAVQENITRVMAELKGGSKKRKRKGGRPTREELELQEMEAQEEVEREAMTIRVNEFLTVSELAELMDVSATEIIGSAFKNLGLMVTINLRLDFDQIEMLLEEFGFKAVREEEFGASETEIEEEEAPEDLKPRPPVVTVMGHVDHGKTLLLDRIRKTNVVAGEAGGITQHIGAYHVELGDGRKITFLDTPGHAAFTAMRARGADITDIVILVVAADDSIMPQTIEAISHARNAGVPVVVAVNKVDLPAANPKKVKQALLQHEIQVEDFGGTVLAAEISAKTGQGVEDLLEKVLLQAEMLELKANPDREAHGAVIEAELDVGKGPVVTILVQRGTLRVGDDFLCGLYDGRIRAMMDERGKGVREAGPGIPIQILGCGGVPQAGDTFQVMGAVEAGGIAQTRQRLEREKQLRVKERGMRLGDFSRLMAQGQAEAMLPLIIKGDVDGSVQAVADALEQLGTDEVQVDVIHRAVGAINESDVLLAETAGAIIIGFRVRPDTKARQLAERDGVEIHMYDVIYNAVDDIRLALEGLLRPEERETILGAAEVRDTFRISKLGTIAGCYVTDGVIARSGRARLVRNGVVVYDGDISSLKRFKDDAREVREGFECGIGIANFNDVKVGDLIECYKVEEFARTLAGTAEGRG